MIMAWYQRSGPGKDVFVSTRIRLARNLVGYPFEGRLTDASAKEMIERVSALFPASEGYEQTDMQTLSAEEAGALCEKHYISPEFAAKRSPHALIREESKGLSIMICEEDHLRIQALAAGFAPEECMRAAFEAEERIDGAMELAYDEKLGYLTHCPTNLGTAMRVSVMMFLPALTMEGRMPSLSGQLQKLGLVIRGTDGEGSEAVGYLYQISNRITLGISEEETVRKVSEVVRRIAETERRLRRSWQGRARMTVADRGARALGVLSHAKLLSGKEFLALWADLRLSMCCDEKDKFPTEKMDALLFEVMRNEMAIQAEKNKDAAGLPAEAGRDLCRAERVRAVFASMDEKKG
ncbi:MAG: ATP--guanido phosphotransferase [Clostridia bacterium]|nr:ATP--guanido phosphotransferase [Clostridia bacterium]